MKKELLALTATMITTQWHKPSNADAMYYFVDMMRYTSVQSGLDGSKLWVLSICIVIALITDAFALGDTCLV